MGQCGVAKAGRSEVFAPGSIPELAGKVVAVKSGAFHTLALTKDGDLYAFGRGRDGQLGNGRTTNDFAQVSGLKGVVSFAAGTWHSAAVLADGSVWLGRTDRVQMIAISFSEDPDPEQVERRAWQKRVKESFDFAALAALLK